MLYLKALCAALIMLAAWSVYASYCKKRRSAVWIAEELGNDLLVIKSKIIVERRAIGDILRELGGAEAKRELYQNICVRLKRMEALPLSEILRQETEKTEKKLGMQRGELGGFVLSADAIEQNDPILCAEGLKAAAELLKEVAEMRKNKDRQRGALVRGIIFLSAAAMCLLIL